jgi:GAF domain-containing protein
MAKTLIAIPLRREDRIIGSLSVVRDEVRPFTEREIALLETFADQAVIAIENARLFEERERRNRVLSEALEQQTATAEILRVIASLPNDLQAVLDTIAESAVRLVEADRVAIHQIRDDALWPTAGAGEPNRLGFRPTVDQRQFSFPLDAQIPFARAVRERRSIRVADAASAETMAAYPDVRRIQPLSGNRSTAYIPLLKPDGVVGALNAQRHEVRPFSERDIALLETFADQAVIAIENARLFEELERRNRDLREALEQQTVTAEVLRVIASSPTDLRSVLQSVVESAARLCDAKNVGVWRADEDTMERMANSATDFGPLPGTRTPLDRGMPSGRVILDGQSIHVLDLQAVRETEFPTSRLALGPNAPFMPRTYLSVPLVREGVAIGAMSVERSEVRAFTSGEIALMETFADQAVIAIENARLFSELQESNRQVSEALEQQTALAEVLRVIASSPTDLQAVLTSLTESVARLCDADGANVQRIDGDVFTPIAMYPGSLKQMLEQRLTSGWRGTPITSDTFSGRAL